jgi:hypothetical protein
MSYGVLRNKYGVLMTLLKFGWACLYQYDLGNRYRIFVYQITTDMFHLSLKAFPGPFLIHDLSQC